MRLSTLLAALAGPDAPLAVVGADPDVAGLTADSRAVRPGLLFAALAGSRADGSRFIADAVAKGAAAVLLADGAAVALPDGVAVIRVREPRRALALLAAHFHGAQPGKIVAVTGTNGKTSIVEFTRQILAACGRQAASLGTIGVVKPGGADYGGLTTPDPVALAAMLRGLADEGITHLALEASSHGLDQFRLDGVRLAAGAFNNLGRDHLDYHPTMEAYLAAKLRLWELLEPGQTAVVNEHAVDARTLATVKAAARARGLRMVTVGAAGADVALQCVERCGNGQVLEIAHRESGEIVSVQLGLVGAYQAQNACVAAALAIAAGEVPAQALRAIGQIKCVTGRLETVAAPNGGLAIVDYAHKPEALAAALIEIRKFMGAGKRLVCVFGCGGDRDRGKRPIMGRIARELADEVIVTNDNPRSEPEALIRQEILCETDEAKRLARTAIQAFHGEPHTAPVAAREIGDRAEAIRAGIVMLRSGDVLLVAGKGHETGQIVGDKVLPFSDHDEILQAVEELSA